MLYRGTAILWRKTFTKHCFIKTYDSDRIIGIELICNFFTALFLCVYLPYDFSNNLDDYMFYLSKLLQIIDGYPSPYIFLCGDFNSNNADRSQFGTALSPLCSDHSLCLAEKLFLPNRFVYFY